jgi:putative tricarboxylic transport membrane protein
LKRSDAVGGVLIFIFGTVTAYLSLKMPIGSFRLPGPGMFPLCLGLLLMVLSSVFAVGAFLRHQQMEEEEGQAISPEAVTSPETVIGFMAAIAAATALLHVLGYAPTAFLLLLALLRMSGLKRWRWNILTAFSASAASHFLFVQWLKIPFPRGWFGI